MNHSICQANKDLRRHKPDSKTCYSGKYCGGYAIILTGDQHSKTQDPRCRYGGLLANCNNWKKSHLHQSINSSTGLNPFLSE